ncbi:MAG: hypothetical protein ABC606_00835 [Candidatus Methanosuratincola petrocarbonis]
MKQSKKGETRKTGKGFGESGHFCGSPLLIIVLVKYPYCRDQYIADCGYGNIVEGGRRLGGGI